jgi:hypothetical protein
MCPTAVSYCISSSNLTGHMLLPVALLRAFRYFFIRDWSSGTFFAFLQNTIYPPNFSSKLSISLQASQKHTLAPAASEHKFGASFLMLHSLVYNEESQFLTSSSSTILTTTVFAGSGGFVVSSNMPEIYDSNHCEDNEE